MYVAMLTLRLCRPYVHVNKCCRLCFDVNTSCYYLQFFSILGEVILFLVPCLLEMECHPSRSIYRAYQKALTQFDLLT